MMDGMGGNMYMRLVYLAFDGGKITNSVTNVSLFHNNYIQSLCLLSLFQSVSRLLVLVSVAYPIGLTGQGHPDLDPYTQPCESLFIPSLCGLLPIVVVFSLESECGSYTGEATACTFDVLRNHKASM